MPLLLFALLASLGFLEPAQTAKPAQPSIEGRWDLTIHRPDGGQRPSWLEVRHSGVSTLVGQFVGTGGSARPIALVEFKDGEFRFSIPPQWERIDGQVVVAGRVDGDRISGTITTGAAAPLKWTGVRAPSLRRAATPSWDAPTPIFTGKDLSGWRAIGANEWEAVDGVLRNKKSGGNLVTEEKFTDFKLHTEFRYPAGGNSGVYLRGRYELQIIDSQATEPSVDSLAAVYGFLAPTEMAARKAGEWQSLDVTLVGRIVNVVLNGKTIICDREIPGITGGALDSQEGTPGPLLLQGDHGPIEFRNMTVARARQ
jgi:hypothetical protein